MIRIHVLAEDVWQEMERQWPLEKLPCRTYDSRNGLRELLNDNVSEFKWQLMEAYDKNDNPIHPTDYPKLRGAIVLCHISISRWEVKRKYTFSPHIVQLQVLVPSRPFGTKPETPKKPYGLENSPRRSSRRS
ncbi:hypothetical protein K435DRAFT_787645 [Dendrothele bispora CBS 962.96]|uniref:Uncharacterized protein n=1 Tax=Dendrothele bispora (strain CBS 962.96) TaxID=1314807 RepID=A0A4S8KIC3_DENBC|nr:hypothetical protein K435DRAFT_787645 [Dendrothele bispora CBS 962.96]